MGAPEPGASHSIQSIRWTLLTVPDHPASLLLPPHAELLVGRGRRIKKCSCLSCRLHILWPLGSWEEDTTRWLQAPQVTALTLVSLGTWGAGWTWRASKEGFCKEGNGGGVDEVLFLRKQQLAQILAHGRCSARHPPCMDL